MNVKESEWSNGENQRTSEGLEKLSKLILSSIQIHFPPFCRGLQVIGRRLRYLIGRSLALRSDHFGVGRGRYRRSRWRSRRWSGNGRRESSFLRHSSHFLDDRPLHSINEDKIRQIRTGSKKIRTNRGSSHDLTILTSIIISSVFPSHLFSVCPKSITAGVRSTFRVPKPSEWHGEDK